MTKLIYIDAGHGGKDPGACANGLKESYLSIKVVKAMSDYLQNTYECKVYEDTTADSLNTITSRANKQKADLFVSVHFNAGGGDGWEGLIYSKSNDTLGNCFKKRVSEVGQNVNRGIKYRPDLAVTRLTNMPAILNEIAFIDNKKDIKDWDEPAELKKMGIALAKAAADFLKLSTKKPMYQTLVSMNLRKEPNLSGALVGAVPAGVKLTGTVNADGWLKTTYNGKAGYVRQKSPSKVYCKKL